MNELQLGVKFGLYLVLAIASVAAVCAVTAKNIFHAALCLIVTLIGVAAIYVALEAEFLAFVQILIYVGAIMTLIIFSIMMTERIADQKIPAQNNLSYPAIVGVLGLLGIMTTVFLGTPWIDRTQSPFVRVSVMALGKFLLNQYVFPFEVISVFLIAALIGAIIIAKKDSKS